MMVAVVVVIIVSTAVCSYSQPYVVVLSAIIALVECGSISSAIRVELEVEAARIVPSDVHSSSSSMQ